MHSITENDTDNPPEENSAPLIELFDPWARQLGFDKPTPLPFILDLTEDFSNDLENGN